jgi:hypothetical protein
MNTRNCERLGDEKLLMGDVVGLQVHGAVTIIKINNL